MYLDYPPAARAYQAVMPVRFKPSPNGWRTTEGMAEFLGLSRRGFLSFTSSRGHGRYGPKYTPKVIEKSAPIAAYTDEAVATWLLTMSKTEQHWLAYHQLTTPSAATKAEAEAARLSMYEAAKLIKQ